MRVAWVTGASSGIGAACVAAAPADTKTVAIARRPVAAADWLQADLSTADGWDVVLRDIRARLDRYEASEAVFVHMAGSLGTLGDAATTDAQAYVSAFMLNAGSTLALGQGFLAECRAAGVPGTFVVSSSPAASAVLPGMSQYCAAKAAVAKWVEVVAAELEGIHELRVLGVVPHAVDTPMVRDVMDERHVALSSYFAELADGGQLATPELAATHLWEAVLDPTAEPLVAIGARWLAD